ncbi:ribosomal-protein-alanine N-acetyltransferase [Chlamydia abortus]|jgi:L-amino acid N-acyltransferase YncA|uniref:GNAT family N-acetyltransferase n=1 Tax=Paenibacillus residui TaxID=629724 RepID=A0ABW3D454_9BACL|nr:GNAT family N-acetyltransferase [Robertmurraya siralis]SHE11481.1 ribosomal-protein-alanine N-acetyltransferase [Chlamydia abortus]
MEELIFHDINMEHIPIVNSWYCDTDSFHVEKLTEFIHYVTSNSDYDCWMISSNNEFIGKVGVEIEEDKAYISIIIRPDYRRKGYGKKALQQIINKYMNTVIKQMIAGIFHTNEASKRLFLSVGFIPLSNDPDEDGFINVVFHYKEKTSSIF